MDFEWNLFLITVGMLISFGMIGIGVCVGENVNRRDKEQRGRLDTGGDLSDMRRGDRCGDNGYDKPLESEKMSDEDLITLLYNFRIGATMREKRGIDQIIDGIEKGENKNA